MEFEQLKEYEPFTNLFNGVHAFQIKLEFGSAFFLRKGVN